MYVNYLLANLTDVPAFFLATCLVNRIGRKKTNLFGCLGSSIFIVLVPVVPKAFVQRHTVLMVLTIGARWCCFTAFMGAYAWTPELFPTVVRAQGMSICGVFEKVAMISVPFVITLLSRINYSLPHILMCVLGLLGCVAIFPLPETVNQPTKETFEDFFQNPVAITQIGIDLSSG